MAARPKSMSGITSSTDVNLDFLTKEEKEALLNQKMDMIRQRNKALSERHQMIEADKKKAEDAGNAVKPEASKTYPAEGPQKSKGRGRGQSQNKETNKSIRERPKSSGDFRDSSNHDAIVDAMEKSDHKGRGRGGHRHDYDRDPPINTPKNRRKGHNKEEAATPSPGIFDYEPIVDMSDLDLRFGRLPSASENRNAVTADQPTTAQHSLLDKAAQMARGNHTGHRGNNRKTDENDTRTDRSGRRRDNRPKSFPNEKPADPEYDGRLKGESGPPPDPSFNPLSDSRRYEKRMDNSGDNRRHPDNSGDNRRHPRNYGGGSDLAKVKQTMKKQIEREKDQPIRNRPLDIAMTGKERRNHEEWKQERERCDRERIQRSQNNEGSWKRAWDVEKYQEEFDPRQEPAKRPAGRIGSGRFDRGEREDRPRSQVLGKGGLQQSPDPPSPLEQYQSSSPKPGEVKAPGKGRGRGRGRGRGKPSNSGGDKSPRPRTWSGGDDRFVECQKEMLLVKFENTAGDNSVEVVYGDEDTNSPPPTPTKSTGSSVPGRGPTGRTPNQMPQKSQTRRGKSPQKQPKSSKQKNKSSHSGTDLDDPKKSPPKVVPNERGMVRSSSSHSHSYGDTDEWEDCTESSGVDELQVECRLNPDAPEFLPTSPDFMKTPPGHIKCLNWTAGAGVGSPTSSLSQNSATSPRLPANFANTPPPKNHSPKSTVSSPGSSVSQKAAKRREEIDSMPMGDEPHPPPFVLDQVTPKEKSPKPKGNKMSDVKKNKEHRDDAQNKSKNGDKVKNQKDKRRSESPQQLLEKHQDDSKKNSNDDLTSAKDNIPITAQNKDFVNTSSLKDELEEATKGEMREEKLIASQSHIELQEEAETEASSETEDNTLSKQEEADPQKSNDMLSEEAEASEHLGDMALKEEASTESIEASEETHNISSEENMDSVSGNSETTDIISDEMNSSPQDSESIISKEPEPSCNGSGELDGEDSSDHSVCPTDVVTPASEGSDYPDGTDIKGSSPEGQTIEAQNVEATKSADNDVTEEKDVST